jgi:hypothetical protein
MRTSVASGRRLPFERLRLHEVGERCGILPDAIVEDAVDRGSFHGRDGGGDGTGTLREDRRRADGEQKNESGDVNVDDPWSDWRPAAASLNSRAGHSPGGVGSPWRCRI